MSTFPPENVRYIVVHCSATKHSGDYSFERLERDHLQRGFREVGYNAYIRKSGRIHFGRSIGSEIESQAAQRGFNSSAVSVCLEGGLDDDGKPTEGFEHYTPIQRHNFLALMFIWSAAYPAARMVGHRDLSPDLNGDGIIDSSEWRKNCPCFDVLDWSQSVKPLDSEIKPSVVEKPVSDVVEVHDKGSDTFEIGQYVVERRSSYSGVVQAVYLHEARMPEYLVVASGSDKEGEPRQGHWFHHDLLMDLT